MPDPAEIERWRLLAHRWQEAFEHSVIGQACTGLDGRFIEVNDRFCEFLGYDRATLMATTFMALTHPGDLASGAELTRRLMSGELKSGRYEKRYLHAGGRTIWADVTVSAVRDPAGVPLYFATLVVDISERKRLDAQLHERDALLSSLSRNIPGTVLKFVIGMDGSWTLPYASDGIGELYELDPQLLRAQPMLAFDRVHDEDRPGSLRMMEEQFQAMQANGPSRIPAVYEFRLVLPRKGLRHARAMISLEREADGATALYCYITDISEQKQYEQALVQAQAAQAASRAKTEFLSRMSHELRTPLNAVIGFAQLQRLDTAHPLQPVQAGRNAQIESAGAHLLGMIGDVLDLSRIEAGDLPLSIDCVDLHTVLHEALAMVADTARDASVALVAAPATGGLQVRADRLRLRQVLLNLLSNAVKYNRRGGEVRCTVVGDGHGDGQSDGQYVRVSIDDTGRGLTPAQLSHLFEPFNRLGAEQSGVEGTGIGLVIVRHLVERMAGSVHVSSIAGEGTRFEVKLPAAAAHGALR